MIAGHLQEKKGNYYAVLSYKGADFQAAVGVFGQGLRGCWRTRRCEIRGRLFHARTGLSRDFARRCESSLSFRRRPDPPSWLAQTTRVTFNSPNASHCEVNMAAAT